MSPPVRNMRVSWGRSLPLRIADDVSLRLDGSPNYSTVRSLTLHDPMRSQLNGECRVFLDIRTSSAKERFDAGTVESPIDPPRSITKDDSSIEHISAPGELIKWRVYVVSPDGHKRAEMREYSTYGATMIGSENNPMLRLSLQEIAEGQLWELRFEQDSPVVCIPPQRLDLHDSLRDQKKDCWLLLGAIVDKIFDELLRQHAAPNETNIDTHTQESWQDRWIKSAGTNFECQLPEISGEQEDTHRLHTWKKKVVDNIASSVNYQSKYDEPEDD